MGWVLEGAKSVRMLGQVLVAEKKVVMPLVEWATTFGQLTPW